MAKVLYSCDNRAASDAVENADWNLGGQPSLVHSKTRLLDIVIYIC